ncbi:MAG: branched-chain amino acid ABC transporter permease [Intrasporangium sp.]|uniref:branched-chain amino acid ABC transporter permease n=1 Tax=Intrasporangium sp. TaxID=1925024 RepID=UPI002648166F|nr:branched-chain amino acid ABC transporter permease [Intrasporangium sp.]MDN5794133.1 branched-chain amino acid ABC transporter permease [Intrasporangium sp.]
MESSSTTGAARTDGAASGGSSTATRGNPARRPRWKQPLATGVAAALLILLPLLLTPFHQDLATRIVILALLAMSLDLIYGYAGMISLGHAAFFGAGGYTVGMLMVDGGVTNFWVGMAVSVLVASVVAAIVGFVALRTRGIYFILVTFAMGQMIYSLAQQWDVLQTSGAEAVVGIAPPEVSPLVIQWTSLNMYYFTLVVAGVAALVLYLLVSSRYGLVLRGIRENQQRMSALGYNTWLYQYSAFIAAGAIAGVAGVLFAYYSGIMAPANVGIAQSGLIVLMIIIGGVGRLWGGVIGAVVVELAGFLADQYAPDHKNLVLGALFVVALVVLRAIAITGKKRASRRRSEEGAHVHA